MDRLLKENGLVEPAPIPLSCDNQSAIRLVKNPEFHQRTKHIDIKYHFVRETLNNGVIDIQYVGTKDQIADVLTKSLKSGHFKTMRHRIGIVDVEEDSV